MHGVNSDTGTLVHWVHVTTTDSVHSVNSDTGTQVHVTTTDFVHGVNSDTGTLGTCTCHHNRLCAQCK